MEEVKFKIYVKNEFGELGTLEGVHPTVDTPIEFAKEIARGGFSTTKVKEGQLDYYPPHRILKVTVL